ncbi:glutaredoxin family protein [Candidatus Uhrbacteria bacterium]|jgi:glutaredoxin 3|nr:glutaredoxin family protein [Candidatus Uhrbacteria bacterium]
MKVTVYSTPTCPFCKKVKGYLSENKVEFTDIDVSADQEQAQKMIAKSGQMGVPVTDIDGELVIGFDEKALKEKLGL